MGASGIHNGWLAAGLAGIGAALCLILVVAAGRQDLPVWLCPLLGAAQIAAWCAALLMVSRRSSTVITESRRQQSEFVAAVSHEFRSPLTTISHLTELLANNRLPTPELRKKCLDHIGRETRRLNSLVEDLLDFGRIESNRRAFEKEAVDLRAVLRDALNEFQQDHESVSHFFDLREAGSPLMSMVDSGALRRALRNLLENAVKYSPPGATVHLQAGEEPACFLLSVRDEGPGVPAAERAAIFQRFVRGREAQEKRIRGTGIGLALVKSIVEAHGGQIVLDSAPGQGSTFILRIPKERK